MSSLIRSADAAAIRSFAPGVAPRGAEAPEPSDPAGEEHARLIAEIARLESQLAAERDESARALEEALARGRREGRTEAEDRERERAELLRQGLTAASRAFSEKLDMLDGLAAAVAQAALEKLLEPDPSMAALVKAMLARQFAQLRAEGVIALRVSAQDFADEAAIAALRAPAVEISRDPALAPGSAHFTCRAGEIELDLRKHWSELSRLLRSLARGEA